MKQFLTLLALLLLTQISLKATILDIFPLDDEFYDNSQSTSLEIKQEVKLPKTFEVDVLAYDSLFTLWRASSPAYNFIDTSLDSTFDFSNAQSDSVYKARLSKLISPIHLPYNQILKRFLVSYTTTNKSVISHALGRAQYYFPIIEQELLANDLPLELRMIPVVESVLRPEANSGMGAAGMWQFIYSTAKIYKLNMTSFIDERRDPLASTKAACWFLKDLYRIYGEWTLAIAAYNCGPGNVNKAIKRAGGKVEDFWDIYHYLPHETRAYVPLVIAANYACNYHLQHSIEPLERNIIMLTDTIQITKLTHLGQVSSSTDISLETLRALNPQYKKDIIPAVEKPYPLVIPQSSVLDFISKQSEIMAKDTVYLAKYIKEPSLARMEALASTTIHKVKSGDTLSGIAKKYNTTVSNLLKWNKLKRNSILRLGQKIEIHK